MSKNSTKEEVLGELHRKVAEKYKFLIDNIPDKSYKEITAALNGATKFLNDNNIKAVSYIEEIDELEETLNGSKKRDFGNVVSMKK